MSYRNGVSNLVRRFQLFRCATEQEVKDSAVWQDVSESRTRRNVFAVLEEEGSEGAQESIRVAKVGHFAREWRHCELHLRKVGSQSHLASIAKRSQQTGVSHEQLDTLTRYRMNAKTKTNSC